MRIHPSPGGTAYYSLCTSDGPTSWYWAWGPEVWEDATGESMKFDLDPAVPCSSVVEKQIQWEGYFFCPASALGCYIKWIWSWHNDPVHGVHKNIEDAKIVFDYSKWSNITDAQRRAASAHEMGHGVGLDDHSEAACQITSIMGLIGTPPCLEGPTFWDAVAAMCNHSYC